MTNRTDDDEAIPTFSGISQARCVELLQAKRSAALPGRPPTRQRFCR